MKKIISSLLLISTLLTVIFTSACEEGDKNPTNKDGKETETDGIFIESTTGPMMYKFTPSNFSLAGEDDYNNYPPHIEQTFDGKVIVADYKAAEFNLYTPATDEYLPIALTPEYSNYEFRPLRLSAAPDGGYVMLGVSYDQIEQKRYRDDRVNSNGAEIDYKDYDIQKPCLSFYDEAGNMLNFTNLNDFPVSIYSVYTSQYLKQESFLCDKNGFVFYFSKYSTSDSESHIYQIFIWDKEGNHICTLPMPDDRAESIYESLYLSPDGEIYLLYRVKGATPFESQRLVFRPIDTENLCYGEISDDLPESSCIVEKAGDKPHVPVMGDGYLLYSYDHIGVYGHTSKDDEKLLFKWSTVGLSVDMITKLIINSPGEMFVHLTDPSTKEHSFGKIELVTVESVYGDGAPPILTLAIDEEDNYYAKKMLEYAAEFVRVESCLVNIVSYSSVEGGLSANQKLARDIAAGNSPDLVVFGGGLEYETLSKKGVFADLYEIMDGDSDFSRFDLLPCVREPFERDGKLDRLVTEFNIYTISANKSVTSGFDQLTLDELARINDSLDDDHYLLNARSGTPAEAPAKLLKVFLACMTDELIDYENGTCDTDSLGKLIKLCADAKVYVSSGFVDSKALNDGRLLFNNTALYTSMGYYLLDRYGNFPAGEIDCVGFPTVKGSDSNSVVYINISSSIIEHSENKEKAWELIKYFISSKERQIDAAVDPAVFGRIDNFPCTYQGIKKLIERTKSFRMNVSSTVYEDANTKREATRVSVAPLPLPEDPEEWVNKPTANGYEVYFSDEDGEALLDLLEKTGRAYSTDSAVAAIVMEEASYYFSGTKSLDEIVRIIGDRIETKINE